jgi:hypothetical protein
MGLWHAGGNWSKGAAVAYQVLATANWHRSSGLASRILEKGQVTKTGKSAGTGRLG